MTPSALLNAASAAGITVRLDGDRLVVSAAKRPDEGVIEDLRREMTNIVAYLRGFSAWTDEDWQALFDERAGIIEFDGGRTRADAEERAREEVEEIRRLVTENPR